jgi:hypothetical protein
MSSHTRHGFPLCRIQHRVTLDIIFLFAVSNVESHSTWFSSLPYPMSSHTRHGFPLFRIQCRVTLDMVFRSTASNVELGSTRCLTWFFVGFSTKLRFLVALFLYCEDTRFSVKLNWTGLFELTWIIWTSKVLFFGFFIDVLSRPLYKTSDGRVISEWFTVIGFCVCGRDRTELLPYNFEG